MQHDQLPLLRQWVYALCQGYENLNNLRRDLAFQTAVERDTCLDSSPTLYRLENRADRAAAVAIHQVLIEQFITFHERPPEELILDFDATDDRVHGDQEGRFFHSYYEVYYFPPLYAFCGPTPASAVTACCAGASATV